MAKLYQKSHEYIPTGDRGGIGEKSEANLVTDTSSMSVLIAISPGRSGLGPQFNLTYDSGSGNGPVGFGWSLLLPAITRMPILLFR